MSSNLLTKIKFMLLQIDVMRQQNFLLTKKNLHGSKIKSTQKGIHKVCNIIAPTSGVEEGDTGGTGGLSPLAAT